MNKKNVIETITVFPALSTMGLLTLIAIPFFALRGDFASTRFFIIALGVVLMLDLMGVVLKRLAAIEHMLRERNDRR